MIYCKTDNSYPIILYKIVLDDMEHTILAENVYLSHNNYELDLFTVDTIENTITEFQWHSIYKRTEYRISIPRFKEYINSYSDLEILLTNLGEFVLWGISKDKSVILLYNIATKIPLDLNMPLSFNPTIKYGDILKYNIEYEYKTSLKFYLQHFVFRYLVCFDIWNKEKKYWIKEVDNNDIISTLEYIEEALYDCTYDKSHDGGLLKYHEAGIPKKLAIKWHKNKSEYTAFFWFEETNICEIFEKFYGAHRDTKTDFIIRIDAEQKKYELALYRYGLKEPLIIPEEAYQLLVFKNKFEHYRSENYNQERGAWIW